MASGSSEMESLGTPSRFVLTIQNIRTLYAKMSQQKMAFVSTVIVLAFLMIATIGPMVAPHGYDEILRGADRRALRNQPPSNAYIFGTDSRGRDILSRLLWGARETIGLPVVATTFAVAIGTIVGLSTGYIGGWFDEIFSRIMDTLLAIPALVLALVMLTTIVPMLSSTSIPILKDLVAALGANSISLIIVIILVYVPIVTRVVRSAALNVRDSGYVEEARLRGERLWYILFKEIFPGVLPTLIVEASLRLSYAIFLVASLGFLGLGVQPPSPEWGRMVLEARDFITTAPWTIWFPVLAIATLIVSLNLMSDGLRRVLRNEDDRI